MLHPPAVPLIDDLLGNTTLYEEQRGDFLKALQAAEQHLAAARAKGDPLPLADALLARGIVQLLRGETGAARASLDEADQQAAGDPERRLRARLYAAQSMMIAFNQFPNGGVPFTHEISTENFLKKTIPLWNGITEAAASVNDPVLALERQLLERRHMVMLARQAFTAISSERPMRETMVENLWKFRQSADIQGAHPRVQAALALQIADAQFRAGHPQPALDALREAGRGYERLGDAVGVANCLMKLGDWHCSPFGPPEVMNSALAESAPSNALRWEIEAAEFDISHLDTGAARTRYEEARDRYRQGGAVRGLAAIELRCGYLATFGGDGAEDATARFGRAARHAAAARNQFLGAGDLLGAMVAKAHLALHRVGLGQQPEDQQTAEEIGAWGRTDGSFSFSLGLGLLFARIGRRWQMREGDHERALRCFRLSEALFRALGVSLAQTRSVTAQSLVYRMLGEHSAFVVTAERALGLCEEVARDDPELAAKARNQANWIALDLFQLANARADADGIDRIVGRMRALIQDQPDAAGGRDPDNINAPIFQAIENGTDMTEAGARALARLVVGQIEEATFIVPLYRGRQARRDGDEAKVRFWFDRAMEVARASPPPTRDFREAMLLGYQLHLDEAVAVYRRHMEQERAKVVTSRLPPELQHDRHRSIEKLGAMFFTRMEGYADAQACLDALIKLDGPNWWALDGPAWENLSLAGEIKEALESWDEALSHYERGMTIFEQQRSRLTSDELKTALASDSSAQAMYFQAARTALKAREAALARGDEAAARDFLARAFQAIERGKARSLLDLMATSAMPAGGDAESPMLGRLRRVNAWLATRRGLFALEHGQLQPDKNRIAALNAEIAAAERELTQIEGDLSADDRRLHQADMAGSQVLALDAVQAALPPDTVLLQYAFQERDLLAWAITGDSVRVHRTSLPEFALKRQLREFHRLCETRQPVAGLGSALADILMTPFEEEVAGHRRLIVVPSGEAYLLPFHALPWRGRPLAAARDVSYLPSASAIRFMRGDAAAPRPRHVLAVGNPAGMQHQRPGGTAPQPLDNLPAAETEAVYIASLFSGSKVLTGGQATAEAVRSEIGAYSLLHFATHGHLSPGVPLLSAIMLAGGSALTVYELMGLRLNADLVVLSACRTGQGETTGGDDVLGLSRALLATGVRTAIVSLWPVNDLATSILMGEFYRWLRDGAAPVQALQAAQEYLRTRGRDAARHEFEHIKVALEKQGASRSALDPVKDELDRFGKPADQLPDTTAVDYSHPFYWAPFILMGV